MAAAGRLRRGLTRALDRRVLRRWGRAADRATRLDAESLASLRARARALRTRLDRFLAAADARLSADGAGDRTLPRPLHSDWAWRPELWRTGVTPPGHAGVEPGATLGGEAQLFHDCPLAEISVRQAAAPRAGDPAPRGVVVEVFRFEGSFLSLAIDLPPEAALGLTRRHVVRLGLAADWERPLSIYGRLNIRHGPNTGQVVREFPMDAPEMAVEFDLGFTEFDERRVERVWLDLILDRPEMNRIVLRDLTLARRPRAEV